MESELEQVTEIYKMATEFLVNYSFQIIGAVIILLIGLFVASKIGKMVQRLCLAKNIDVTLSHFIGSTVKIIVIAMVAIVALGKLGISVTPFVAAIGALTFGISLAAQGLIANYGAGFNIIIGRPFVVGDTISVCGVSGQVTQVKLGLTKLVNEDNITITIPNKHIIGEILHNSNAYTLVEASVGIAYGSDMDAALNVIEAAIKSVSTIPADVSPVVGIENFGDSSVSIGYRYKVHTEKLFLSKFAVNKAIFTALKQSNIEIPFPQREVKML
ncbi:mechanosensitive ion channel [Simiduia litorea]|uniref:mechanosensitive ion channel family protein n=1 Tax=Simiduia litorea TaxID=1435348 RepID=UPI0036F1F62C